MNMVFNPMSTTVVCSITLLHLSRSAVYLPLQPGGTGRRCERFYYTHKLCDQELYGLRSAAEAVPWLVLKGLELAGEVENVTALVMSRPDDRRLTSLTNAIKEQPLCKVWIREVWQVQGKKKTGQIESYSYVLSVHANRGLVQYETWVKRGTLRSFILRCSQRPAFKGCTWGKD